MGWIAGLIRALWGISRQSWAEVGFGLRPGSPAARLVVFLTLVFFVIGLGLVLLGFDLAAADRWLEAQGGWLDLLGKLLFRALLAAILLLAVLCAGAVLYARLAPGETERPGWGAVLAALPIAFVIGYFCWVGLVSPL